MKTKDIIKIMGEMKDIAERDMLKGHLTPREQAMHDKTLDVLKSKLEAEVKHVFK